CNVCRATSVFCAAYDTNYQDLISGFGGSGSSSMSNAVAGVVGAAVTMLILILLLAGAMLLGGLRFHRSDSRLSRRSAGAWGGFKGSAKMASDADLVLPRNGAPMAGA